MNKNNNNIVFEVILDLECNQAGFSKITVKAGGQVKIIRVKKEDALKTLAQVYKKLHEQNK